MLGVATYLDRWVERYRYRKKKCLRPCRCCNSLPKYGSPSFPILFLPFLIFRSRTPGCRWYFEQQKRFFLALIRLNESIEGSRVEPGKHQANILPSFTEFGRKNGIPSSWNQWRLISKNVIFVMISRHVWPTWIIGMLIIETSHFFKPSKIAIWWFV